MKILPTQPDQTTPVDQVVFLNMLSMIWNGQLTIEQANKQLDQFEGFPKNMRFWGKAVRIEGRGQKVHYLQWVDGAWYCDTKERERKTLDEIRAARGIK